MKIFYLQISLFVIAATLFLVSPSIIGVVSVVITAACALYAWYGRGGVVWSRTNGR